MVRYMEGKKGRVNQRKGSERGSSHFDRILDILAAELETAAWLRPVQTQQGHFVNHSLPPLPAPAITWSLC